MKRRELPAPRFEGFRLEGRDLHRKGISGARVARKRASSALRVVGGSETKGTRPWGRAAGVVLRAATRLCHLGRATVLFLAGGRLRTEGERRDGRGVLRLFLLLERAMDHLNHLDGVSHFGRVVGQAQLFQQ